MVQVLIFHLLLLLCLPFIWHELTKPAPRNLQQAAVTMAYDTQAYYDQSFSYAMQNLPKDGTYEWHTDNATGSIRAAAPFISPSHAICRSYTESYNINGQTGTSEGFACLRGNNGSSSEWCKLRVGSVMTCALEKSGWLSWLE